MNIYLLDLVGKWLSIAFVSIVSLFDVNVYQEEAMKVELSVKGEKDINVIEVAVVPTVVSTDVEPVEEVAPAPEPVVETVVEQQEVVQTVVEEPTPEIVYDEYVGKVTGYGPGCPGCSAVANVACRTKEGNKHSLLNDGIYYYDETYGNVRILAAASQKFPCGTIIEITKDGLTPYIGIVLDRGGTMDRAWINGVVHLDLAYESNSLTSTDGLTGTNLKFSVKRWGW